LVDIATEVLSQSITYRFEKLSGDNIGDLVPIYNSAFQKDISINELIEKFDTSFTGFKNVGFIAYAPEGEPAAFYGVFPCFATYNGVKYLVAQSGNTMTHANHTGRGLFTALAKMTYDYCRENRIHLVFGFPNQNSYPGFIKKLDWKHFDDMRAYLIRVKCVSWIRIKRIFRLSEKLHQSLGNFMLSLCRKGTAFQSSCNSDDTIVVDHNKEFLAYKSYAKNYLLEIEGVNVWLKFNESFLLIGDIEKCSDKVFIKVIAKLKLFSFFMGLSHIRIHCSSGVWLEKSLVSYGAHKRDISYPIGGINLTQVLHMGKMKFTTADNDTF
jgi:hypothetical protein